MGKKPSTPLQHSRNEATLRNVRAAATRDKHLRARLDALTALVSGLITRVTALEAPLPCVLIAADAEDDRSLRDGRDHAGEDDGA